MGPATMLAVKEEKVTMASGSSWCLATVMPDYPCLNSG